MNIDKEKILSFILKKLQEFINENEIDNDNSISEETRLIGGKGILDSMDLVTFIVELEEGLEEDFSIELSLADEKAMSRRTSPFINPTSLTNYILESINE